MSKTPKQERLKEGMRKKGEGSVGGGGGGGEWGFGISKCVA